MVAKKTRGRTAMPGRAAERRAPPAQAGEPPAVANRAHHYEPRDFAAALFHYVRPAALRREGERLLREGLRILRGESELDPGRDRRFADPAFREHPFYRRLAQAYLAGSRALEGLLAVDDEDPLRREKARLLVDHLTALAAPTNTLLGNPAALRRAWETRGRSLLAGVVHLAQDLLRNRGFPSQVDPGAFQVGRDLAVTPGGVVYRSEFLELIQYAPRTGTVHQVPVFIVPPQINRFYFLDLAPGRSFVEFLLEQGFQVFVVSWKNPTPEQGHWRLEDYVTALERALDAASAVGRSPRLHGLGFCAGGITLSAFASWLGHRGEGERLASLTFAVTLLDFSYPALIGILKSDFLLGISKASSKTLGVLAGDDLAMVFTLLRPRDLIWDYWVNNYLMGNPPPAFDILAWNRDSTNLPAGLHRDYLAIFDDNLLAHPGGFQVLGVPVDLGALTQDAFVVGAVTDHLTPWKGCYRTTQLLGGRSTFVLSSAGHVAALVNPPGNPKAWYMTGPPPPPDPDDWLAAAQRRPGSWWEAWVDWAAPRSGRRVRARRTLGDRRHPVLAPAPGTYVFERA
ncbi:MAG: class II poly(R)-hydroxyalkanoic acid synthase [Porticoccaceae bacterium]|nr:MAG: class II poly(R)-hydroxyalkanoic acid synthase [Porticoccaceae bacterium]